MDSRALRAYVFGSYRLDLAGQQLLRDGKPLPLKPKAYDTLLFLLQHRDRVVGKEELLEAVWPRQIVEDANLSQNIYEVRRALDDGPRDPCWVQNVPRRGYRFIGQAGEEWAETNSASAPRSIAVLPFRPLVAQQRDEPLELGLTDAIVTALSRTRRIRVRPLGAVLPFAGPKQEPLAVAARLQVESVLEGTLQVADGRLRVSARLWRVADGVPLWAGRFDTDASHLFEVEDAISVQVAAAVELQLGVGERRRMAERRASDPVAHAHYLKGRYYWHKWTPDAWRQAIVHLEQALALAPDHAPSYAWLGAAYATLGIFGCMPPGEAFGRCRTFAQKALEHDPALPEAYEFIGAVALFHDWNWTEARTVLDRSIELNPSSAGARNLRALLLAFLGEAEASVAEILRARDADPLSLVTNTDVGSILYYARRHEQALAQVQATLELDPHFAHAHFARGHVLLALQRWEEALAAMQQAIELSGAECGRQGELGYALACAGQVEEAGALCDVLVARGGDTYVDPYQIAIVQAGLRRYDDMFASLEHAFAARCRELITLAVNPVFDPVRGDPRYLELAARVGLPS